MKKNNIILSVIVPCYNSESSLEQCVSSIISTNRYDNSIEIILINDGSTDGTLQVCKELEQKYSQVVYVNTNNCGVSHARNLGISLSRGEYLMFVDSDDFLSGNYYKQFISIMEENNFDAFYFCHTSNVNNLEEFDGSFYEADRMNFIKAAVWRYIFRKDVIVSNKIIFSENIKFSEDFIFNLKYVFSSNLRIGGTSKLIYFYRLNDNQSTNRIRSKGNNFVHPYYQSYINGCKEIMKFGKERNILNDSLYIKCLSQEICSLLWGCFFA